METVVDLLTARVALVCVGAGLLSLDVPAEVFARDVRVEEAIRKELDARRSCCVCVVLKDLSRPTHTSTEKHRKYAEVQETVLSSLSKESYRLRYRYRFSPALVLQVLRKELLGKLEERPDVVRVRLDREGSGALLQSRALIHADEVHDLGITGEGTVVAVLDSGVDTDHPDLADAIIHQKRFLSSGSIRGDSAEDGHGHGTNVTGIIASRGRVAQKGVAPGTLIVAIKVLNDVNRGFLSDWAAGVEHAVKLHEEDNGIRIDAINMSLQSDHKFESTCDGFAGPFAAACRRAEELGIAVFASSGNSGSITSISSPACYSPVIAVGSVYDTLPDRISPFTSRNALLDLLAPGQSTTSTGKDGGTSTFTGTSQAAPHAAAVACLLREVAPSLSPQQILGVLQTTGVPIHDEATGLTFPRIDALAAVTAITTSGDCDQNDVIDFIDIFVDRTSDDCNENRIPDQCDVEGGSSLDRDGDGVPDECMTVFHRGDPNDDGAITIDDAIFLLGFLYLGNEEPTCRESADANNDGELDVSDGILILTFLFLGHAPPAAPGPPGLPCGSDTDETGSRGDLGCALYTGC